MLHGAGIFTYIWVIFRANVGKFSIHGAYGIWYSKYNELVNGVYKPTDNWGHHPVPMEIS